VTATRYCSIRLVLFLPLFLGKIGVISASGGEFSLANNYAVVPGTTNEVEIALDDTSGVASIALKVNYDPNLLDLLAVTNKPGLLGANFALVSGGGDGTANIVLTRQDALGSGSGVIATLLFRVNPGAAAGMSCELPVVRHELSGLYGVHLDAGPVDYVSNAKLWIVSSMTADSDGDGIPDAWEITNFGGPTNAAPDADADSDGQSNRNEFRSGTNPQDGADCLRIVDLVADSPGGHGLVVRWASVPTVKYTVDRSTNLVSGFDGLASNIVTGATEGSYTDETATVEGAYFYRVLVK
jgi:hypothetical protein